LPFIDGVGLCEILRRDYVTAAVPIVIVTGETRPSQLQRVSDAGADVVLVKPISPEAVLREIDRLSDRRMPVAPTVQASSKLPTRAWPTPKVKAHARFATTTPPAAPPSLTCPSCDRLLAYQLSHLGGVSDRHVEQWDYHLCSRCGAFRYRQRTRKVQRLTDAEQHWMTRRKA
jgi:CheY-like chemotaxis protein